MDEPSEDEGTVSSANEEEGLEVESFGETDEDEQQSSAQEAAAERGSSPAQLEEVEADVDDGGESNRSSSSEELGNGGATKVSLITEVISKSAGASGLETTPSQETQGSTHRPPTVAVSSSTDTGESAFFKGPKPFLGGYVHRMTGVEYHHASSQTTPQSSSSSDSGDITLDTVDNCTQTAQVCNRGQQTPRIVATQVTKNGIYISCINDKVLTPRRYVTADQMCTDYMRKVIVVQSYIRRHLAKRRVIAIKRQRQAHLDWLELQRLQQKMEKENRLYHAANRQQRPRTMNDFNLMYNSLEKWRQEELTYINKTVDGPERKAALCILTDRERRLLDIIQRRKVDASEANKLRTFWKRLNKTSTPKTWVGQDNTPTKIYTAAILRAKHLQELYYTLTLTGLSEEERLDALVALKDSIRNFDTFVSREIMDLADREADLLVRGIKVRNLEGLHRRILILFTQCLRSAAFNPEYGAQFKPPKEIYQSEKQILCESCRQSYPPNQFIVKTSSHKFGRCRNCLQARNEAHERKENSVYRFILSQLRVEEKQHKVVHSAALLIEEVDFRYLVDVIWCARSAISNNDDPYDLLMCRWLKDQDWTPWNCILLTVEERTAHYKADDVSQVYNADFLELVNHRHVLARHYFVNAKMPKPKVVVLPEPEMIVAQVPKAKRCDMNAIPTFGL